MPRHPERAGRKRRRRNAPGPEPGGWDLIGILCGTFLLKLVVTLALKDHVLTQPDAGLDTTAYVGLAKRVLGGDIALGPGLYFVSPLYIYFLSVILAITDSFTAVRLVQTVLGTCAVGLVYVATREWFGRRAAALAATLAALTGELAFYEALVLQAALDPFLTAAAMACLAIALKRSQLTWFALSGFGFGAQTLNRPNIAIAAVGVALLLACTRRWLFAATLAAGMVLAVAPVTIRNIVVAGEWFAISSHGGLNFYIGNHALADGTYITVPGITPNLEGQQNDARRVAEQATGRVLDDGEVSAYFFQLGWRWVVEHPVAAATLFVRKLRLIFSSAYVWLNYSYPFFAHDSASWLSALPIGPWFLIPMGILGLVAARPRAAQMEYLIWSSFVPLYAISVAMFFVADRYTLPLLIPLCTGAGAALDTIWHAVSEQHWSRLAILGTACAIGFVVVARPPAFEDGVAEERTRMAERLITLGRYEEAAYWRERALQPSSRPGLVHFRLGQRLFARGEIASAIEHFETALRVEPAQPEVEYVLGEALLEAGRPQEAAVHLQRARDHGFDTVRASEGLVRALGAAGERERAIAVLRDIRPKPRRDGTQSVMLGELAMQLEEPQLAETFFIDAIAVQPSLASAHFGLAAASATLGRLEDAQRHLQETLRLDPGFERARQLLRMIQYKTATPP